MNTHLITFTRNAGDIAVLLSAQERVRMRQHFTQRREKTAEQDTKSVPNVLRIDKW